MTITLKKKKKRITLIWNGRIWNIIAMMLEYMTWILTLGIAIPTTHEKTTIP